MTEDQWRSRVVARLRKEVGGRWDVYPRTRFARAGVSDIFGCVKGRFVAIELKVKGSGWELTALQKAYLDDINRSGGYARPAWTNDDILAIIEEIQLWPT